jgi:hypothetical protein
MGWMVGGFQVCHMGQFLVFPTPAVAINFQNPGFIPDDQQKKNYSSRA